MHESFTRAHEQSVVHRDIVQDYLDALLQEASASAQQEEIVSIPAESVVENNVAPPSSKITTVSVATTAIAKAEISLDPAKIASPKAINPSRAIATERDIPEWGRQGFAALLFEVAGIKMAAPLHALGGICLIEDNLQSVVAQAEWFMGLLRWNDRNLRVIDTARFVMPERIKDNAHRAHYQSVIILGDSHWALAVDQADESTNLSSQDVRWKHLLGTRPWLAGTLLNRLCALVDVDSLTCMLDDADHSSVDPKEKH